MSYKRILMYSLATPTYNSKKKEDATAKFDESLDANNPANFNHLKIDEE